jgi:pimeloyl-ACP methyl ester carboxylesterase
MDLKLKTIALPVLVTHGAADRLIQTSMARYTANAIPGAKLSIYDGIGHTPFYEDATRFNAELASFVRGVRGTK